MADIELGSVRDGDCLPPAVSNPLTAVGREDATDCRSLSVQTSLAVLKRAVTARHVETHDVTWLEHLEKHAHPVVNFFEFCGVLFRWKLTSSEPISLGRQFWRVLVFLWVLCVRLYFLFSLFQFAIFGRSDFDQEFGPYATQAVFSYAMGFFQLFSGLPNLIFVILRLRSKVFREENTSHLLASLPLARRFLAICFLLVFLTVPPQVSGSSQGVLLNVQSENLTMAVYSTCNAFIMAVCLVVFLGDVRSANAIVERCIEKSKSRELTFSEYLDARDSIKDRVKEHNAINGFLILVAICNILAILLTLFLLDASNPAYSVMLMLGSIGCFGKELLLLLCVLPAVVKVNDNSDALSRVVGESDALDPDNGLRILHSQLVHPIVYKVLGTELRLQDIRMQLVAFISFFVIACIKLAFDPQSSVL